MNDKGSLVVEMSLITPVLLGCVFFAINIFIMQMNSGHALGKAYSVLYTKSEYGISRNGEGDTAEAEAALQEAADVMMSVKNIETQISYVKTASEKPTVVADGVQGEYEVRVSYTDEMTGVGSLIKDSEKRATHVAKQEIRDTAGNLRRWQVYGQLLSK